MRLDRQAINRHLARKLAVIMERETREAFRSKSWDGMPWAPVRTPVSRGSLMLRNEQGGLHNSLTYQVSGNVVTVSSSLPYASIHNEGGRITVPVTDAMRRHWWSEYYKSQGRNLRYKAMALSKKSHWTINMPQRQFVGITAETERELDACVDKLLEDLDLRL